ncbi:MAG TPA: glycoside hydrolase family 15 protein [Steroidobacteraceae bacterium]|nr:glycoside hydrolase family 15 protein [Steroidobacteraceae bacterium]
MTPLAPRGRAAPNLHPSPVWACARKDLVGTSVGSSRVWFTLAEGVVSEIYYPRIDIPQIRDLGFIVADGAGFWCELRRHGQYRVEWAEEDIPAATIVHSHPRFTLTLRVCTDPSRDVLLIDYRLDGDETLVPHVLLAPRLGGDAEQNEAWAEDWLGHPVLWAEQGPFGLALLAHDPVGGIQCGLRSVGSVGVSDLWQDFSRNGRMCWSYAAAGPGEVALGAALARGGRLAVGLATSKEAAATLALSSLMDGFDSAWAKYLEGWRAWRTTQTWRGGLSPALSADQTRLLARSASVLKIHGDRTYRGAMVASLAVPWGEASTSRGGYHLVWARDLVESAGALIALGALDDARDVLAYLAATQQADGHWLQNQWLGGRPFWQGVQLDESAFPVLLAAALKQRNALGEIPVRDMILRALRFIVREGPVTSQDRWEEDAGINAFTLAVTISALVEGAAFLDGRAAAAALLVADDWNAHIEEWCWTENTPLAQRLGVPGYYMRAAPADVLLHQDEAKRENLAIKNRRSDCGLAADEQIATDFLQLVRFGLRSALDPRIVASVRAMDATLATQTPSGPVWHRYNGDGYGEHTDGRPFDGSGHGRGWPLLTGERGHYGLLAGEDPQIYLAAMAAMSGAGGLLPEQVWDSAPIPEYRLEPGRPSGSAMPLVWAHAEYVKLCLSLSLGRPVDAPAQTWQRYAARRAEPDHLLWRFRHPRRRLRAGQQLVFLIQAPARIRWGTNGWQEPQDCATEDWGLGHVARLPTDKLTAGDSIEFTFYWPDAGHWEGRDFSLLVD